MAMSIISGLVVGLVAGYTLQRGGFCMHSAFRSLAFEKDHSLVRAWVLILAVNIPVLLLLEQAGIIFPARAPLTPVAGLIGGLVFGVGMVLAGGCVSGTYYRASKGMMGSVVALLGFAGAGLVTQNGVLRPALGWARETELTIVGEEASLFNLPALFDSSFFADYPVRWLIAAVVVVPLVIYLLRAPKTRFSVGWPWWLTGLVLAGVAVAAWFFSSLEFRDYGLSIVQPTNAVGALLATGNDSGVNWTVWFLIALPVGAFLAALQTGDLKLRAPSPARLLQNLGGGILMGFGANLAGGCNIGHGITGLSVLSIGSIWATATTILGVWAATWVVFKTAGNRKSVQKQTIQASA